MSFKIQLQVNNSPINKIGKSLTTLSSPSGTLRNESEIINPKILIETTEDIVKKVNYCTIPNFGRKYFIEEIESVRNNIWLFHCHVDVLDSFQAKILTNNAVVLRQENKFNLLLNDGVFKCTQNPRIYYRNFPSGLGQFNYVLIAQGGPE